MNHITRKAFVVERARETMARYIYWNQIGADYATFEEARRAMVNLIEIEPDIIDGCQDESIIVAARDMAKTAELEERIETDGIAYRVCETETADLEAEVIVENYVESLLSDIEDDESLKDKEAAKRYALAHMTYLVEIEPNL